MKLNVFPCLVGLLFYSLILSVPQKCDARRNSDKPLFERVEKLLGREPTKVSLQFPKHIEAVSSKGKDRKKVAGYRVRISNYSDLEKIRKIFLDSDYLVFICNLDKWEDKIQTKLVAGKNNSVRNQNSSFQVLILKSVKPPDIIRLVSGTDIAKHGISSENVAEKIQQWCLDYEVRIDSIHSHGVDLEFIELPKDLVAFMKDLKEFDPSLFDSANADTKERKERFKDMMAYFKRTKILTLSWE